MKRGAPHGGGGIDDGTARADRYIGGRENFFIFDRRHPLPRYGEVSARTTSGMGRHDRGEVLLE